MSEKKQPGRFTIQFSMDDPQQRKAVYILEEKGRRKAQFITNAVLYYLERSNAEKATAAPGEICEEQLERMLLSVIQKSPQIAAALRVVSDAQSVVPPVPDASAMWEDADTESALTAISHTLEAFKRG